MKIHLLWIHWYVVGVRAFGSAVRNSVPFQSSFDFDRVMLRQHMVPVNGDEEVGSEEEGGAKVNCLQEDNDGEKVMLEEAHRLAMEEDEEWYKSFIMLSKNDFKSEGGDVIVPMKEISDVSGGEEMQENDVNNEDGISENDFDERSLLNNGSNQRKELDPFMSLSTNEMKERLEDLGYCNEDFDKLDDDVINLIIEDSIKRPTNIQFLRQESELRLMILGPDFAETLRNEAKWRLNLYEKWLILLEDGYGEDETFNQQQRYARVRRENRRRRDVIEGRHRRKRNER